MAHSSVAASGSSTHPPAGERESLRPAGVALAGLSTVFLFEMLDNSILNVALPTIGRELHASTTGLQWVTGAYAVVFGGLMLFFGALADRAGRRRVMLIGLVLLGLASLATAFVTTAEELIVVRAVMGVAAAMTTPGSLALAFRLFRSDDARVRATTLISTVGLVGLAIGPAVGGLVLSWAPWQVLLLVNVPIALLAGIGIRVGIPADDPADLHRAPLDVAGALTGTVAVVLLLAAPTMFLQDGVGAPLPWVLLAVAVCAVVLFVLRARRVAHPVLDLRLVTVPLVSSGLLYKAATGLATAGLGFSVTLQLQSDWGWSPFWAAIGMLPQVVVLLAGGLFVGPLVRRLGLDRVAWLSAGAVVVGLGIFAAFGRGGYPWVAAALVLVAFGIRLNGVVAGTNVMKGMPSNRTTIGAALVDTATEVATGVGVAVTGTVLAVMFTGSVTAGGWTPAQDAQFEAATTTGGLVLAFVAAGLVVWGYRRSRATDSSDATPAHVSA